MHKSVLLHEVIAGLMPKDGDIFVDGTLGSAGHSLEFCRRSGPQTTIVGIDRDDAALGRAKAVLNECKERVIITKGNFRYIDEILDRYNIKKADKILFDLGLSSDQLEESGRGFSFLKDEPLLMTFEAESLPDATTAWDVVNSWDEENIADIIYYLGDERYARRIASGIVRSRSVKSIETTGELSQIIKDATPRAYARGKIHPATKTFQAIRMAVNDEIGALKEGLKRAFGVLSVGGRLAVISFHSGEDRIVKIFFKEKEKDGVAIIHTKKPIVPTKEEMRENPRSRSAKLRIIEKRHE